MLILLCLSCTAVFAQVPQLDGFDINANEAQIKTNYNNQYSYLVEVSGPSDYYHREEVEVTGDINLSPRQKDGTAFADGRYKVQVTPVFRLSNEERATLMALRAQNDIEGIRQYRIDNNLPTEATGTLVHFSIKDGHFVSPTKHEGEMPPPTMFGHQTDFHSPAATYASLDYVETTITPQTMDNSLMDDQVILDDLIVNGSACVGQDCSNGESFGFDTIRLKENNLRIKFQDTSNTASFPTNDWQITANDSSNGGANKFSIDDIDGGRTPFTIEAGAPSHSLYVEDGGRVGFGTATPVVEQHVVDGDSPTLRLEQDGSSGFTPQTWDVASNETNFFIRDATNGSTLPFRIRPSAPSNSIFIDTDGDIGLGTASPTASLHVEGTDAILVTKGTTAERPAVAVEGMLRGNTDNNDVEYYDGSAWTSLAGGSGQWSESGSNLYYDGGSVGVGIVPTVPFEVLGNMKFTGNINATGNNSFRGSTTFIGDATNSSSFFSYVSFKSVLHIDYANTRVGIGTSTPSHLLELSEDDAVKPNGGSWMGPSDRRLKTNIRQFEDGLSTVMKIKPVRYHYNGLLDLPTDQEFIGVIAQDMEAIAPYTIRPLNDKDDYLAYDGSSVTYMLVNAVQEQQSIIDAQEKRISELEDQVAQMNQLKAEVAALAKVIEAQLTTEAQETSKHEYTTDK